MDRWEKILLGVIIVLFAFLAIILLSLAFHGADVGWRNIEQETGVVTEKEFVPEHTTWVLVGKIFVRKHHPDSWKFGIRSEHFNDGSITIEANNISNGISVDNRITVYYRVGRLSGWSYLEAIAPRAGGN
jgi:hypothetical protein